MRWERLKLVLPAREIREVQSKGADAGIKGNKISIYANMLIWGEVKYGMRSAD